MSEKKQPRHPYVRPTTPQQRRFLFETYERTHDVAESCRLAHLGRSTFYFWKARFDAGGYAALEQTRSHARHTYSAAVQALPAVSGSSGRLVVSPLPAAPEPKTILARSSLTRTWIMARP